MVREFKLINEKGQSYSLMDIENYCLLTEPDGLGYSYYTEYEQIGNSFITNLRKLEQGKIAGVINCLKYDNYKNLIDFIENSNELKFAYRIPFDDGYKEYLKDINIQSLTKTQKQTTGVISESIIFDCLSLWYEAKEVVYAIDPVSNELRWDFRWDSIFSAYDNRNIIFENKGHEDAPFKLELKGEVVDPKITILEDDVITKQLDLEGLTINQEETFIYNTKDTEQKIIKTNGTAETNLFEFLNPNFINFFKLRKGVSTIKLEADNEITSGKLTIYVQYKAV